MRKDTNTNNKKLYIPPKCEIVNVGNDIMEQAVIQASIELPKDAGEIPFEDVPNTLQNKESTIINQDDDNSINITYK
ncbi:hypothetical protein [Prevotella amnii]|uniref:hypothetical protein n=1 Tax=Prevotella amnii TaxID=419005 RepID=UPI0002FDF1CE|nr:hypothetical protein [Prevotella amnii]